MNTEEGRINTGTNDLLKFFDEDERLFTAIVLRPDVVDSHGDIYSPDVVKQACHDYVQYCMASNAQHIIDLEKSDMAIVESFIAPVDIEYQEGTVLKGDWVMTAKIYDDDLWKMVKTGKFTGFSVGVQAVMEILSDES